MKYGVLLGRFQPFHKAHLYMIENILKECDYCVCVIGSSNKKGTLRNPFDIKTRIKMVRLATKHLEDRIIYIELPDMYGESNKLHLYEWGSYLYYNIISKIEQRDIVYYYADDPKYLKSWFNDDITPHISYRFLERCNIYDGLSATKIREAFVNKDLNYINKYLPKEIVDNMLEELIDIYLNVLNNPKEDFQMK